MNWDAIIVADEVLFSATVDLLGGALVGDIMFSGQEIVAFQRLLSGNPNSLLDAQSQLVSDLRFQMSLLGPTPDLTAILALIPEHGFATVPPANLAFMASQIYPVQPENIEVRVLDDPQVRPEP